MFRNLIGLFAGLAFFAMAGTASAAVIVYDNFGPGNSYDASIGYTISANTSQGVLFSPSSSGLFSQLTIAAGTTGTPPTPYQINLHTDSSGAPGAILESLNFSVSTLFGTNNSPTVVSALGSTFLDATMTYWLTAFSPTEVNVPWNFNSIGDLGSRAISAAGPAGPWSVTSSTTLAAFRVEVNSVPEPSTLLLFGLGFLGLAGIGWCRRQV